MRNLRLSPFLIKIAFLCLCFWTVMGCTTASEPQKLAHTLVVYYSDGNDGIQALAQDIAKTAKCHLFKIQANKDYAPLMEKLDAGTELTTDELDDLFSLNFTLKQPVPENWNAYDRILLGCPLWLDGAATPVRLFLEQNDLSDKSFHVFTIGTQSEADVLSDQLSLQNGYKGFTDAKAFENAFHQDEVENWLDSH